MFDKKNHLILQLRFFDKLSSQYSKRQIIFLLLFVVCSLHFIILHHLGTLFLLLFFVICSLLILLSVDQLRGEPVVRPRPLISRPSDGVVVVRVGVAGVNELTAAALLNVQDHALSSAGAVVG